MWCWNGEFRTEEELREYRKKTPICKICGKRLSEGSLCDKCRFKIKNKKIFEFFEEQLEKYNTKKRGT